MNFKSLFAGLALMALCLVGFARPVQAQSPYIRGHYIVPDTYAFTSHWVYDSSTPFTIDGSSYMAALVDFRTGTVDAHWAINVTWHRTIKYHYYYWTVFFGLPPVPTWNQSDEYEGDPIDTVSWTASGYSSNTDYTGGTTVGQCYVGFNYSADFHTRHPDDSSHGYTLQGVEITFWYGISMGHGFPWSSDAGNVITTDSGPNNYFTIGSW